MLCNQITERAAIALMGGARTGHINSLVSTEMDYCAACGSLFKKSTTNGACKDVQPMLLVCVSVLLLNACKTDLPNPVGSTKIRHCSRLLATIFPLSYNRISTLLPTDLLLHESNYFCPDILTSWTVRLFWPPRPLAST